ncbi:MAG: hypothetical protein R2911_18315 [Caldilineaceae bacterium]
MTTVTMPLPRMNNPTGTATVTFNLREMPFLDGPGIGAIAADAAVDTDAGEWSLWQNLEGAFISAPAAAAWGDQQIDLFGISTDSQLYHKRWDGAGWTLWESLEGTCIYAPTAVARGANLVDVFVIGLDKQVYRKTWDGAAWQGWEELGGTCIHGLAAASWGPDRIDLFTVGTNSCLYHNYWDGAAWQGWEPLRLQGQTAWEKSSTTIAAPAAVASAPGRIDLFVLGIDNQIYQAWGDGETWQGWINLGGPAMHGLAVAARGPQALDLFTIGTDIEGTDNHMYHRAMSGASWGAWDNLGGACISAPAAVALGESRLDAFVVGTRSALFQKTWQGAGGGLGVQDFTQPEKDDAKLKLNTIRSPLFTPLYKTRAQTIIDNPHSLDQGPWGVCGMATAVYFLLQYDLDKYIDLVKSIFDGDSFSGIPVGMKERPNELYSVLLYGRERKQIENVKNRPEKPRGADKDFDFIVSRSLGKLLKIVNPIAYQIQVDFSKQFDPLFSYKETSSEIKLFTIDFENTRSFADVIQNLNNRVATTQLAREINAGNLDVLIKTGFGIDLTKYSISVDIPNKQWELQYKYNRDDKVLYIKSDGSKLDVVINLNSQFHPLKSDGDLALDLYGQRTLMKQVIGARTVDFTFTSFGDESIKTINSLFDRESKPFVLATINGYVEWCGARGDNTKRTFDVPPAAETPVWGYAPLRFVHIIGVTGKIRDAGAYYEVPVWTWAAEFTVKIKKELFSAYLYSFVYGSL